MTSDPKSWLASKGVWGGLIAVAAGVAGVLGYNFSTADQASAMEAITAVISAFGGLLAIWGRVSARQPIA